jgi:hypothetical protein
LAIIKAYQGMAITLKIKIPQRETRQKINFRFFSINKNAATVKNDINSPKGPLVRTARPEKAKNKSIPGVFLFSEEYPQ